MKHLTVSRSVYGLLKKHGGWANKAEILEWTVPYEDAGKKKTANKDTVARKLRELHEEGWLERKEESGQAYYRTDNPSNAVQSPLRDEIEGGEEQIELVPLRTPERTVVRVPRDKVGELVDKGFVRI